MDILSSVTGNPTRKFRSTQFSDDQLWQQLTEWKQKEYPVVANMKRDLAKGLTEYAAFYAVTDLEEVDGNRLVKIYRRSGYQYNETFSDRDLVSWTPEAKEAAGNYNPLPYDGSYFMKVEEFRLLAPWLYVNYFSNWNRNSVDAVWNRGVQPYQELTWKITNNGEQDVFVGLEGTSSRHLAPNSTCQGNENRQESMRFSLYNSSGARLTEDTGSYQQFIDSNEPGAYLYFPNLPAGEYTLKVTYASVRFQGPMNFTAQTFGSQSTVAIN